MKIVNGQPVFGTNDVVFRNDGQYAYDDKGNVMGLWDGSGNGLGNALNTDQTSFLKYLQDNKGAGITLGLDQQRNGDYLDSTLTGGAADIWSHPAFSGSKPFSFGSIDPNNPLSAFSGLSSIAGLWKGGQTNDPSSNPYYDYMLQLLSGGQTHVYSPLPKPENHSNGNTPTVYSGGYGGYGGGTGGQF